MTPTLIAITGPTASGKDTLGSELAEQLALEHHVQLLSGSALYRSAALFAIEKGHDPQKPLPRDTFSGVCLEQLANGKVKVTQEHNQVIYAPNDYANSNIGKAGSDLAKHSPNVYKAFVKQTILDQIETNTKNKTHSILPARDAHSIAAETTTPALRIYLALRVEEKIKRLETRLRKTDKTNINLGIQQELTRELQDIASGTLPVDSQDYLSLTGRSIYRANKTYRLDTSDETPEQSTQRLYAAAQSFIKQHKN